MKIPILIYHRVVDSPQRDSLCISPQVFEKQMRFLSKRGFQTISLEKLLESTKKKESLSKKIILTFDDGYEDIYLFAFPILKKYGFKATIFLVPSFVGKTNLWDKDSKRPKAKLLNLEQILEMKKSGFSFGAHSLTHQSLIEFSPKEASYEIEQSKIDLEKLLGEQVISFCYPYGKVNELVKDLIKKVSFRCALASDSGPLNVEKDLFEIRRIQIFPKTNLFGFWKKTAPWYTRYKMLKSKFKF
jgi:peptidoglycan/xylan/chitin deacetylase (PgdA/CDA1 family)